MADVDVVEAAGAAAQAAAERAGVVMRTLDDVQAQAQAREVFDAVWPAAGGEVAITSNLLRAIVHAGGYCIAADDVRTGRVVGATMAFIGRDGPREGRGLHLHSHMAAVVEGERDRSIGTAMKLHQRWWALREGIDTVVWTFDPLVRRNARLNLMRLGVRVTRYYADFYGEMPDAINAGDPTDRLLARWEVASPLAVDTVAGRREAPVAADLIEQGARVILDVGSGGEPVPAPPPPSTPTTSPDRPALVALPADIVVLRRDTPDLAREWRLAVREALQPLLGAGGTIDALTTDGCLVVQPGRLT